MTEKLKWGVIGVANIAVQKVIPAMQDSSVSEVAAIASRDLDRAREAARALEIPRAYGSYEELLEDDCVEAIYNPLPNHLHVPWTIRAARAGKHVLCEKPIALSQNEALELIAARDETGVQIQEAFMVHTHPQWVRTRELVKSGRIGEIRAIQGSFSYFNIDPQNVRNLPEYGGGGLMDIGCYPITTSRYVLGKEPDRVLGVMEIDPEFGVDRLTTAILDFGCIHSSFTCATQLVPYQRMHFFGTQGRIEIEIPFNAPPDRPCRIFIDDGDLFGANVETYEFPTCDQYTIQGDLFSRAVRQGTPLATQLEDSIANMAVIDAVVRSAKTGRWEVP